MCVYRVCVANSKVAIYAARVSERERGGDRCMCGGALHARTRRVCVVDG